MSDEELVRRSSTHRIVLLWVLGFIGILIAIMAMMFAAAAVSSASRWPVWVGTALFLAYLFWFEPAARYRGELAYRSGTAPFSSYVAEGEALLLAGQADWIVLFTREHRFGYSFRWLRLVLKEGPPPSALASLRTPGAKLPSHAEAAMPEAAAQELLTFLVSLDLAALTDQQLNSLHSVPCRIAVLRREPRVTASARCWLDASGRPAALACLKLSEIADGICGKDDRSGIVLR